jgi:putative solute:sodium symporter small subunit
MKTLLGKLGLMTDHKTNNRSEIYVHTEAENQPAVGQDGPRTFSEKLVDAYWRSNLGLLIKLLAVWAFVSFGCGVLFVDALNHIQIGGFKLGFWFAQQGAMYVFIVLIFVYVVRMKKIERAFGVDDD